MSYGKFIILDILGSFTTFGLLLLIALQLNAQSNEYSGAYYANFILQNNMLALTVTLESDLKNIGKNYTRTNADPTPIRTAKSNELSFMVGTNLIDWIVGDPSEVTSTQNPNLRYIRRNVNGVRTYNESWDD